MVQKSKHNPHYLEFFESHIQISTNFVVEKMLLKFSNDRRICGIFAQ